MQIKTYNVLGHNFMAFTIYLENTNIFLLTNKKLLIVDEVFDCNDLKKFTNIEVIKVKKVTNIDELLTNEIIVASFPTNKKNVLEIVKEL